MDFKSETFINTFQIRGFMGIEELVKEAETIKKASGVDAAVEFYTAKLVGMIESDNDRAGILNQRGFLYRIKKEYETALKDYYKALGYSWQDELSAEIQINMADSLRLQTKFDEAHLRVDRAILKTLNFLISAKAHRQKGLIYVKQEKFEDALNQYELAKVIIDSQISLELVLEGFVENEASILKVKAEVLEPLGSLYVDYMKDASKAQEAYALFKESLDISLKLDNEQNIVNAVRGLGKVAMMTGKPEEAIPHYETAWDILQKTQYGRSITTTALLLGEAHLANNEPEKARPYLERFVADVQKLKQPDADNDHRKPHFENIQKYIPNSGLTIDKFDEVVKMFS